LIAKCVDAKQKKEVLINGKPFFSICGGALLAALAATGLTFAQVNDTAPGTTTEKVEFSGYTAIECGQINSARYFYLSEGGEFQHLFLGHIYNNLSARFTINEHLSALATFEARLWYNSVPFSVNPDNQEGYPKQNIDLYFPNAAGIVSFGPKNDPYLTFTAGRFEYKYDFQAQNLGEYLFRTGTYPGYVITNFDLPIARIAGLKLSWKPLPWLSSDILLTTMRELRPFYDPSLAFIVRASAGKILNGGAGISFENFASAESNENSVLKDYKNNGYLNNPGDTAYYTFKGTKLLAWFMFDPKQLFGGAPGIFGDQGLRLYAEAIVLGLQNYPASNALDPSNLSNPYGYDTLSQRIPVMVGLNLPAFRVLDVLALEFEWYGCPYQDSYSSVLTGGSYPVPSNVTTPGFSDHDNVLDNWKWSLYVKKTIFKKLFIIGQVARDHLRTEMQLKKYTDYQAALIRPENCYWMLKLKFVF
jgi:hypothetical protein